MRTSRAAILLRLFCALSLCAALPDTASAQGFFSNFNLFGPPPQYRPQEFAPRRPAPRRPRPHPHAHLPAGRPNKVAKKPSAPAKPADTPPPYEPQLLHLSEMLGALTYLQDLCGGKNGQKGQIWRAKMTALMDAETQNPVRRARLAGAYNRGFNGYELNYRVCTLNARTIISRFLNESGKIARDVTHRYGTS